MDPNAALSEIREILNNWSQCPHPEDEDFDSVQHDHERLAMLISCLDNWLSDWCHTKKED